MHDHVLAAVVWADIYLTYIIAYSDGVIRMIRLASLYQTPHLHV